ncbi:hypothetical protein DFH08DRAFT_902135 [Mycena albidolilacea]|uniref:Uncharacterized protein n=1 Tax=Mycena albidolilacea TaxID=1033008 RepID=A0AAD7E9X0_9AGAR|nr:hypothetical protein DFH08DRAFT_902135 [Mycena albidolilacea]
MYSSSAFFVERHASCRLAAISQSMLFKAVIAILRVAAYLVSAHDGERNAPTRDALRLILKYSIYRYILSATAALLAISLTEYKNSCETPPPSGYSFLEFQRRIDSEVIRCHRAI